MTQQPFGNTPNVTAEYLTKAARVRAFGTPQQKASAGRILGGNGILADFQAVDTAVAERIAQLTTTRGSLIDTANEPALPLSRQRTLRLAESVNRQIAELAGSAVCGICQLDLATVTVTIPDNTEEQTCLTCSTIIRSIL